MCTVSDVARKLMGQPSDLIVVYQCNYEGFSYTETELWHLDGSMLFDAWFAEEKRQVAKEWSMGRSTRQEIIAILEYSQVLYGDV